MWMDIIEVFLRSVMSMIVLFFLTKLMGKKQISQMNFFDYVTGITIGSIAAACTIETDIKFYYFLIAMAVYAGLDIIISISTCKSIMLRRYFTGKPLILIDKGKIIEKNIFKTRYDINDLLTECRNQGYFNVTDIYYAVMETNGKLSILPKSNARTVQTADMNISPQQESMLYNVIIDGHIMKENLQATGNNEEWLNKQIKQQNIKRLDNILLATCDSENNLSIFLKNEPWDKHSNLI